MRLIDADKLPKCTGYALSANEVAIAVENAPTIDAVAVVRCKDCKHRYHYKNDETKPVCTKAMAYSSTPDDWFCADGERKGGEE